MGVNSKGRRRTARAMEQKLIRAAYNFVAASQEEFDAVKGTDSISAPVEFMMLHFAVKHLRDARAQINSLPRRKGLPRE